MKLSTLSWILVILSALFDSYASFIVKSQMNFVGKMEYNSLRSILSYLWNFFQSPLLFTALLTFLLAPVLWFFSLNHLNLSSAYPILISFHLLFVLIFGFAFLEEEFTINKIVGIFLLIMSIILLHNDK